LKVKRISGNNIFPSGVSTCGSEITVSAADKSTGIANSDLHLYVGYNNLANGTLAYAGACILNGSDKRPIFGRVVFNINYC